MNTKEILVKLQNNEISVDEAADMLKLAPTKDLGYAVVDHQREMRNGCPEVIYGEGKTKRADTRNNEKYARKRNGKYTCYESKR